MDSNLFSQPAVNLDLTAGDANASQAVPTTAPANQGQPSSTSSAEVHDVVVVGSGPAGYTAAIYAARAGYAPVVIAGAVNTGGALMNTTEVENFPGFPEAIMGPDLMDKMQAQAEKFGATIVFDDAVKFELTKPVKTIWTGNGDEYQARSVILALGSEYRHLDVNGEARLTGHGVSYCATCDGFFFGDQDIVVVGGGDSALEEANFLTRFARKVTVVHRRNQLRASKIMQERAFANPKIEFAWNSKIDEIEGDDSVTGVRLQDTVTGEKRTLPVTGVFIAIGHEPRTAVLKGQVQLDSGGYIKVDGRSSRTNLPGVFACGDVVDHTYRQAVTAAASGCVAALDAQEFLTGEPA